MQNSNVYLFTISRLGGNFPHEEEIYAADEGSLGGGKVISKFCRIELLDDDGDVSKSFWADTSGIWTQESPIEIFETKEFSKKLYPYEWDEVGQIIWIGSDADYDLESERWVGGVESVVRCEDCNPERLRGALSVSVLPYYNVEAEIDSSKDYGVNVDGAPNDEHNFSGVLLAPDPAEFKAAIADYEEVSDLVQLCNKWKADLPIVRQAYDRAVTLALDSRYLSEHIDLVRLQVTAFGEFENAYGKLANLEKLVNEGFFDKALRSFDLQELACFYAGREIGFPIKKEEAVRILREAATCTTKKVEVEKMVQMAGSQNALGDKNLAEELVRLVIESTSDSKLRAQLKKVGVDNIKWLN